MFYVGQEVVAIKDHSQGLFKKGDEFIVRGFQYKFCKCNKSWVDVGITSPETAIKCPHCQIIRNKTNSYCWFLSDSFAPKIDLSEFTSESLIKELEQELVNV